MASGRLSKRELQLKEMEELNRQFRRASFDRRNKEDAAGRAARRSESNDESPDPSRESNCNLHSKVAADNKDQDNYDLKGIQRWNSGMGAMVMDGWEAELRYHNAAGSSSTAAQLQELPRQHHGHHSEQEIQAWLDDRAAQQTKAESVHTCK